MNNLQEVVSTIVGILLPFLMALIKRKWELTENQSYAIVFILSMATTLVVTLWMNEWNFNSIVTNFGIVYAVSQAVYISNKPTMTKIEGGEDVPKEFSDEE